MLVILAWLVHKGMFHEAEAVIKRLEGRGINRNPRAIAVMKRTIEIERAETEGSTYKEYFQGINLRRTLIACFMFAAQLWSGIEIGNQAPYFFRVAGLNSNSAFGLGLGVQVDDLVSHGQRRTPVRPGLSFIAGTENTPCTPLQSCPCLSISRVCHEVGLTNPVLLDVEELGVGVWVVGVRCGVGGLVC
jgi:hypothetical protein